MCDAINLYDFIKEREFIHHQEILSYTEGLTPLVQQPKSVSVSLTILQNIYHS